MGKLGKHYKGMTIRLTFEWNNTEMLVDISLNGTTHASEAIVQIPLNWNVLDSAKLYINDWT